MAHTNEQKKAVALRRRAAGLCAKCGLAFTPKRVCEPCRLREVKIARDKRTRHRDLGLCLLCKRQTDNHYVKCWPCRMRQKDSIARKPIYDSPDLHRPYYETEPKPYVDTKSARGNRRYSAKLMAKSLCCSCRRPTPDKARRCDACKALRRAQPNQTTEEGANACLRSTSKALDYD